MTDKHAIQSTIQKMIPLNLAQEKTKFFFDSEYNPQFTYIEDFGLEDLHAFGEVQDTYIDLAERILDAVMKEWKTESAFIAAEGNILAKADVVKKVDEYFETLKEIKKLNVQLSPHFLARTSIYKDSMNIRLPLEYREKTFPGVLDHEIGTHYVRRWNESHQPWHEKKKQFHFHSHLETEEGLATLNQSLTYEDKHLWLKALHYWTVYWGSKLTFADLFKKLEKYVDDKERRWRMCLRTKRGVKDTAIPEVFTKDQIYLRGVIKVSRWLKKNDYQAERLYIGKIAIEDLSLAEAQGNKEKIVLPWFLDPSKKEWYVQEIEAIRKLNHLE